MLKFGIITDEISQDFEHSLKVIDELGVEYIELQSLWDKEITELDDEELKEARRLIKKWKKRVGSISPHLFFRVPLRAENDYKSYWGSFDEHFELFKNAIKAAKELGTNLVRIFGFESEIWYGKGVQKSRSAGGEWGNVYDLALQKLEKPLKLAEREGITLIVETCFLNNFSSASSLRYLIERSGSDSLRALWDPCNVQYVHDNPYPDSYNIIKDYAAHVHIKDGVVDSPNYSFTFCPPGEGGVGSRWPEILSALSTDNYQGVVSMEAEFTPEGGTKEDGLRASFSAAKAMLGSLG